jgi:hypothetical protein
VREASQLNAEDTNAALVFAIRKLCESIECSVTIRSAQDYDDALEVIYSYHGWTFDEIASCFKLIRTGKLVDNFYDRFKAPQLNTCMRMYADMRAQHQLRNQAKYLDLEGETPSPHRTAQQLSHIADMLQLPAYQPQRTTLRAYDERQQGQQAAAQAESQSHPQTPDLCASS